MEINEEHCKSFGNGRKVMKLKNFSRGSKENIGKKRVENNIMKIIMGFLNDFVSGM